MSGSISSPRKIHACICVLHKYVIHSKHSLPENCSYCSIKDCSIHHHLNHIYALKKATNSYTLTDSHSGKITEEAHERCLKAVKISVPLKLHCTCCEKVIIYNCETVIISRKIKNVYIPVLDVKQGYRQRCRYSFFLGSEQLITFFSFFFSLF